MGTPSEFHTDNPAGMSFAREYKDTITKLQNLKLLALHPTLPNLMGKKKIENTTFLGQTYIN